MKETKIDLKISDMLEMSYKLWEKNKDCYKIEFVCGNRAVKNYRNKHTKSDTISLNICKFILTLLLTLIFQA